MDNRQTHRRTVDAALAMLVSTDAVEGTPMNCWNEAAAQFAHAQGWTDQYGRLTREGVGFAESYWSITAVVEPPRIDGLSTATRIILTAVRRIEDGLDDAPSGDPVKDARILRAIDAYGQENLTRGEADALAGYLVAHRTGTHMCLGSGCPICRAEADDAEDGGE